MASFIKKVKQLVTRDEGASLIEYGLLVAMIAVACVGAVTTLGGTIATYFNNINAAF